MASRQLDLFSSPADVALQPLRVTPLPDVGSLIERIGSDEDWQERTLSEVLELWPCLYDEYVHTLLEPRKQAEEWFKQNGTHYATASPAIRLHYRLEHAALTDAKNLFHSILYGLYSQRMETLFGQAKQRLISKGLTGAALEGCEEFFNDVFQRPDYPDLGKRLPQLMDDLAVEYARLVT
ncbi:hypothetical protein [Spirosoma litoris]